MLSSNQAATTLGVSGAQIRRLCQLGKLKCFKIGKEWIVRESSLKSYVPAKRGGPIKGKKIKADSIRRQRDRAKADDAATRLSPS